jgi:hypothetical protein
MNIKLSLQNQSIVLWSKLKMLGVNKKLLFEERVVSLAKDRLATEQIAKTEQQHFQSAMEEEDYESADQLLSCWRTQARKEWIGLMLQNISKH